ncbi:MULTISPECIES: hypothetical protein [Pseudarthrobacter]|uniref:hypothetical protein n=1 Tax=Pseudarthrobacter TaxID=1742993 RepID=UPI002A69B239|nr:hypothetical protein [Pseudarthrobacter sp. IC2-21]
MSTYLVPCQRSSRGRQYANHIHAAARTHASTIHGAQSAEKAGISRAASPRRVQALAKAAAAGAAMKAAAGPASFLG